MKVASHGPARRAGGRGEHRCAARATLDDRPAVELFRLDELAYDEARFAHDLAALAGARFRNHVARLDRPIGEELSPFEPSTPAFYARG